MQIKPLWIVLAGGLIVLGIIVDLAVASKLGGGSNDGVNDGNSQQQQRSSGAELPGLRGQREIEEASWQEARVAARTVAGALRTHHIRMGSYQGISTGPVIEQAPLGLSANSFDLRFFNARDIRITALDSDSATFTIEVRGSLGHSPAGALRLHSNGEEELVR